MKYGSFILTLGALALGVLCSCSGKSAVEPYAQDRNITAIDLPEIDSAVLDSISKGTYPDSLSGWVLHWNKPLSTSGAQRLYVIGDSLGSAHRSALVNGAGDLDFQAAGLAKPLASLSVDKDSVWRIPKRVLGGRGRQIRTDTVFWFAVWVRYGDGAVGPPVLVRFFLGDEFPPEIPAIDTIVGQTSFQMSFDRPRDRISKYDTQYLGKVDSIRAIWWRGVRPEDSIVVRDGNGNVISHPETTYVSRALILDTSVHRFDLRLENMNYDSPYMVVLQVFDDTLNLAAVGPFPVNTRDATIPVGATNGSCEPPSKNRIRISWTAATDSFTNGVGQASASPNHQIRSYRILLASPASSKLRPVDSLDLIAEDSVNFRAGKNWPENANPSRFSWDGTSWHWTWPNLPPGVTVKVGILARDRSGNPSSDTLFISAETPSVQQVNCPQGKSLVPVTADTTLQSFCIERYEHSRDGVVQHDVTWAQANQTCEDAGGELCSELQWQRACETVPDSSVVNSFGALEAGSDFDTLAWLSSACGLGGGQVDTLAALDTTRRDPRCVSGWGVHDMPGQLAEWTRDVWFANRDTINRSRLDSWSGAYLDTSDYTGKKDVHVIHGGSWLDVDDLNVRLSLARCRGRTYPASSLKDTLKIGKIVPKPDPAGHAQSWGFRCCFRPL